MKYQPGSVGEWLAESEISAETLTDEQKALLQKAFGFLTRCGWDYYSLRVLSHFLLHCESGLKVSQVARLLGISRPTATYQQGLSSKDMIQAAHHRLAGRPYGKLLPRFAGPIAHYLVTHPQSTWYDVLDFIREEWGVSVSTVALHRFVRKYGLDAISRQTVPAPKQLALA